MVLLVEDDLVYEEQVPTEPARKRRVELPLERQYLSLVVEYNQPESMLAARQHHIAHWMAIDQIDRLPSDTNSKTAPDLNGIHSVATQFP